MTEEATLAAVPRNAHALTLFRILRDGRPRIYSATTFPKDPYAGCEITVRRARYVGWIGGTFEDSYGLLEAVDEDWSIVENWPVPSARAFAQLKKHLKIVVEPTQEECEPAVSGEKP